jgi:S1-C subfamily serine protease
MERILAWAMIILLSCVLMLANRVHQLAKERIPNPVINLNVHRFLRIPSELQNVSVRVRANVGKGSGVIIDKKTVLTCCHIFLSCREGDTVWVDVVHGNEAMPMVARIVNLDQARDLALVRLTGESEFDKVAKISRTPGKWGVPVIAVGCPNGNFLVPTQGYFHQPTSKGDLVACLGFWGNSGGPVFDAVTGELLGILREMECPFKRGQYSAGEVYPIYLFYSVPLETIKAYLAEHKQK